MAKNSAASIAVTLQRLANEATEKSFQYNSQEANSARNWQTEMSNTSHQREVEDLKKAGLNPVLSSGGSGAQSYTTSNASSQAESPVNAIGNVYSSQISADATRAAAASSARATRYAAAQQAAAARYAASLQYQNQREHEKWSMDYLKEETKQKINLYNSIPAKSVGGVLDKIAQKSGLYDLVGTTTVKNVVGSMKKMLDNPDKYFSNNGNVTAGNFVLSNVGKTLINMQLARFHIPVNFVNRKLFTKAILWNDAYAIGRITTKIPKKVNSSRLNTYYGIPIR